MGKSEYIRTYTHQYKDMRITYGVTEAIGRDGKLHEVHEVIRKVYKPAQQPADTRLYEETQRRIEAEQEIERMKVELALERAAMAVRG